MANVTKRMKLIKEKVVAGKLYAITDAIDLLKALSSVKFPESVDISVNLGVDPRKSDQVVRGATDLPNGTGKSMRVAVFTSAANTEAAKAAGADVVGLEDLAAEVKAGKIDFDIAIASPDAMRVVGQLGQILGPRGLMPNPKVGTVTPDVASAIKKAKAGQARFRTDKAGIIHCSIGKVGFTAEQIKENLQAVLTDLKRLKPANAKGVYMKKLTLSTTMGPGVSVDFSSLEF